MVDESRFRYRRDEGAAEAGARLRAAPAAAAPAGGDPLAELARLIGDDDPFDDFTDLESDQPPQAADPRRSAAAQRFAPPARAGQYPAQPARAALQPPRPPVQAYEDDEDEEEWDDHPAAPTHPTPSRAAPPALPARADAPRYAPVPARAAPVQAVPAQVPPVPAGRSAALSAPQARSYESYPVPQDRGGYPAPNPYPAPSPYGASDAQSGRLPGGDVRTGYGSLSRGAAARAAPPPADDYDDDDAYDAPVQQQAYGRQDPRSQDPRALGYRDPQDQRGRDARSPARYDDDEDEAGYAFSAARRDDDAYDEYDDAYDPEYADDGYMPPHGEDLYEPEPRRRRGRMALVLGVSVLGLLVAGAAGVFAYNMAVGKTGGVSASNGAPPVIKADSAPAKTASQTPPPADPQKLIYDRVGAGGERVVSREEQPVDVTSAARAPASQSQPPQPMQASQNLTEPKKVRTLTVRADGSVTPGVPTSAVSAYAPTQNPVPVGLPQPNPVTTVPAAAPVQTASTDPTQTGSGAYVVQVASQRSESDAMGSWRALQTKYPNLLGNYRATVKKVDLGDKGIYYRAQVGPFASRDQANDLCQSLRAQGGDCVVNKN